MKYFYKNSRDFKTENFSGFIYKKGIDLNNALNVNSAAEKTKEEAKDIHELQKNTELIAKISKTSGEQLVLSKLLTLQLLNKKQIFSKEDFSEISSLSERDKMRLAINLKDIEFQQAIIKNLNPTIISALLTENKALFQPLFLKKNKVGQLTVNLCGNKFLEENLSIFDLITSNQKKLKGRELTRGQDNATQIDGVSFIVLADQQVKSPNELIKNREYNKQQEIIFSNKALLLDLTTQIKKLKVSTTKKNEVLSKIEDYLQNSSILADKHMIAILMEDVSLEIGYSKKIADVFQTVANNRMMNFLVRQEVGNKSLQRLYDKNLEIKKLQPDIDKIIVLKDPKDYQNFLKKLAQIDISKISLIEREQIKKYITMQNESIDEELSDAVDVVSMGSRLKIANTLKYIYEQKNKNSDKKIKYFYEQTKDNELSLIHI